MTDVGILPRVCLEVVWVFTEGLNGSAKWFFHRLFQVGFQVLLFFLR